MFTLKRKQLVINRINIHDVFSLTDWEHMSKHKTLRLCTQLPRLRTSVKEIWQKLCNASLCIFGLSLRRGVFTCIGWHVTLV